MSADEVMAQVRTDAEVMRLRKRVMELETALADTARYAFTGDLRDESAADLERRVTSALRGGSR